MEPLFSGRILLQYVNLYCCPFSPLHYKEHHSPINPVGSLLSVSRNAIKACLFQQDLGLHCDVVATDRGFSLSGY